MTNKKQRIFLAGGIDLEMLTIQKLLDEWHESYLNLHLNWDNALLSRYAQELDAIPSDTTIYGIELREDMRAPHNYVRIDHHNDLSESPSALEQVATLLAISLNRHQQLVAANDHYYIPGMLKLNATGEEIAQIRQSDRKAQGVTKEDELLAVTAIENKKSFGNVTIVEALSFAFSPICDRLYPYEKLLIYTSQNLVYYGENKYKLVGVFQKEIILGKMFHGGNDSGYFGIAKGYYNRKEILDFVKTIKDIVS